jgi:hypothetical protein
MRQKSITDYVDPVIFNNGPINTNQKRNILLKRGFKVATKKKRKKSSDDVHGDEVGKSYPILSYITNLQLL